MIVNSRITESPFTPKAPSSYVLEYGKEKGLYQKKITQRKENQKKEVRSVVDQEEKYLKKGGKLYYGYKKHIGVE
ncbi:MAG: hypothetical protein ACMUEL_03110 [Flavobacteriales bacterium Tduv]